MDNATPINVQPTWDYWATVEATDLTQIAGEQSEAETEIALPPMDGAVSAAGVATPTTATTAIAYQLPSTGSGSVDGGAVGFALLLLVLIVLAMIPVVRRFLA